MYEGIYMCERRGERNISSILLTGLPFHIDMVCNPLSNSQKLYSCLIARTSIIHRDRKTEIIIHDKRFVNVMLIISDNYPFDFRDIMQRAL